MEIVAKKLIININESGTLASAVLLYQVNDGGSLSKMKSVSVTGGVTAEDINSTIAEAVASAETSEGL